MALPYFRLTCAAYCIVNFFRTFFPFYDFKARHGGPCLQYHLLRWRRKDQGFPGPVRCCLTKEMTHCALQVGLELPPSEIFAPQPLKRHEYRLGPLWRLPVLRVVPVWVYQKPEFSKEFDFLKRDSFIHWFVSLNLCMCVHCAGASYPRGQGESDVLELQTFVNPHVGAGKWTWVLWESRQDSEPLSHISSTILITLNYHVCLDLYFH